MDIDIMLWIRIVAAIVGALGVTAALIIFAFKIIDCISNINENLMEMHLTLKKMRKALDK